MAGTLFGLPMSQQTDETGAPLAGGLLYVYDANTSTPANTYSDFALTSARTHPIQLDSAGRIPAFYVDDGSYRARLTSSTGVVMFDEQSITAIGASSGDSGGGASQDTTTIFQTGDVLWLPISGTRSGWVRLNGFTIGSGSSAATERANSDCQSLFEYFWNNFSDSLCAVGGGRGASATADFNANKVIATLDMRSKGIFGLGDMGNSSSAGVTGESTVAATAIGASTFTIVRANLPSTNLSIASLTGTVGSAFTSFTGNNNNQVGGGGTFVISVSSGSASVTFGGSIPLGGSDTDMDILPPVRVGTFYIKL